MRESSAPLVSTVTTVFNGEAYLADAIDSLREQTVGDVQIIVVSDGSTDASAEVAFDKAREDPRVEVVDMPRLGRSAALNVGLRRARAPYVAILDADDLSHPRRLELQTGWLADQPETVGAVGSQVVLFEGPSGALPALGDGPVGAPEVTALLRRYNPLVHSSMVFRASALEAVGGYDEGLARQVDYDIYIRLAAAGMSIHRLEPILAAMRIHENQNFLAGGQLRYRLSTIGVQARALREVEGPAIDHAYFAARIGFQAVRSLLPDSFMANRRLGAPVRLAPADDPRAHSSG